MRLTRPGATATTIGKADIPIYAVDSWGILEFVVVSDVVPPLLPVHFLSSLGSQIDLDNFKFSIRDAEVPPQPLIVLPSGHVALNAVGGPACFELPDGDRAKYPNSWLAEFVSQLL